MNEVKSIELSPRWQVFYIGLNNGDGLSFPRSDFEKLNNSGSFDHLTNIKIEKYFLTWPDLNARLSLVNLIIKYSNPRYCLLKSALGRWAFVLEDFKDVFEKMIHH